MERSNMYLMKIEETVMILVEKEYWHNSDDNVILKFTGEHKFEQIKDFILDSLRITDGNPIQVCIPLGEDVLNVIEELGLYLNNKGYLSVPYTGMTKDELTAIDLLRRSYKI